MVSGECADGSCCFKCSNLLAQNQWDLIRDSPSFTLSDPIPQTSPRTAKAQKQRKSRNCSTSASKAALSCPLRWCMHHTPRAWPQEAWSPRSGVTAVRAGQADLLAGLVLAVCAQTALPAPAAPPAHSQGSQMG